MSGVAIRVLGPLGVDDGAPLGRRDRVVLAVLTLRQGRAVGQDSIADALWPDGPPATATKVVQGCVARLRTLLGPHAIRTTDHGYVLESDYVVDAVRFEHEVARGRELAALAHWDRAAFTLREALALWDGPAYQDLAGWDDAVIEAARLDELRQQAEELEVESRLHAGDHETALVSARRLVAEGPLREVRWRQLALSTYRSGRHQEALDALHQCRHVLREELGLDPSSDVDALENRILTQDPSLMNGSRPAPQDECPWPGLASYEPDEARSFFGRETELAAALAQLRGRGVLVVVGPSGVGKSSFLRAGLIPALRGEGRRVSVLFAHPGLVADRTLSTASDADVLVLDQLESLFAGSEAADVIEALVDQAGRGLLVLALRADRLTEVARHPELARLVEQGIFLLTGLSDTGLRAAVERPARQAGLHVEPGLVDVLLRDLEGEPGALPLLSHALVQTWQRREGRTLTVDGYRESGGIRGAVAQSAEGMYGDLTPAQQDALRDLMLRLVSPGPEGEAVRVRMARSNLDDGAQGELVETLIAARLLTSDEGTVTLAHEALARAWPRLKEWLDDDVEGRRTLHHLSSSAEAWQAMGRPDSELYRGVRLARAAEWAARSGVRLTPTEQQFLDAGRRLAEAEERSAADRARHEARINRRLRVVAAGLATALVVALVAGYLAVRQSRNAERSAVAAEGSALTADARRAGARALVTEDAASSLLLAAAASRVDPSRETNAALQAALARWPQLVATASVPSASTLSGIAVAPDGSALVVTDRSHHLQEYALSSQAPGPGPLTPRASAQVGGDEGDLWHVPVAWSRATGLLAVVAPVGPRPVRLLDAETLEPAREQLGGWTGRDAAVSGLATTPDGRYLAAAVAYPVVESDTGGAPVPGPVVVWDLGRPGFPVVGRIRLHSVFNGVALSADGRTVWTTNPLQAYDVRTGRRLWGRTELDWNVSLALQPSEELLATPDLEQPGDLDLVDATTGHTLTRLRGHDGRVADVRFSHDGRMVATAGSDGLALVWDVDSGALVDRIDTGAGPVSGVAFAADDRTLYTVKPNSRQLHAWDLDGSASFLARVPVDEPVGVNDAMVRPDHTSTRVAFMGRPVDGDARQLRILDSRTGRATVVPVPDRGWFGAGSWSPDDTRYAIGFDGGLVQVVDADTGRLVARRTVLEGMVTEVSHSADGRHLVAVDDVGNVVLLDASDLTTVGEPVLLPQKPYAATAAPDGHTAFVSAGGTEWRPYWDVPITHGYLVDLQSGEIVWDTELPLRNVIYSSYSPDGERIAIGGRQGEVAILSAATGTPVGPTTVGHAGDVYWITYNDDGSLVTSGSTEHDLALWDGRTGALVATAVLPATEGTAVAGFRPDGTLLVASFGGSLFTWDPSPAHALEAACAMAGRDLTEAEWKAELPDQPYQETCPTGP